MGMPGFPGSNGIPGLQGPPGGTGLPGMDGCNGTDVRTPSHLPDKTHMFNVMPNYICITAVHHYCSLNIYNYTNMTNIAHSNIYLY